MASEPNTRDRPRVADPIPYDPIVETARLLGDRLPGGQAFEALTALIRASQLIVAGNEALLRPTGLSLARYEVLSTLFFSVDGSLPIGTLANRLLVHATSVTSAVNRLERDGYVRRAPNPLDRRIMLVGLTPAGRRITEKATDALTHAVSNDALSGGEYEQLAQLLHKLRRACGDTVAGRGAGDLARASGNDKLLDRP